MLKNRLSKVLAAAGVASRRAAEELIFAGRVKVNGAVVLRPETHVSLAEDEILVDGKLVSEVEKKVYYLLNKPRGYLSTNKRQGPKAKLVIDLFEDNERLFTVGRLDKDTEGLLIVTNDGHFANRLIHPSRGIEKEYVAKVAEEVDHEHLQQIAKGVHLQGAFVKPVRVSKVRRGTVKVVVMEGKKHEVRELLGGAGLHVLELKRVRLGSFTLGSLPVGSYRPLKPKEIAEVMENET